MQWLCKPGQIKLGIEREPSRRQTYYCQLLRSECLFANGERPNLLGSVLKEPDVTEDEIEVVAEELAKAGGLSWYPGRQHGSLLRVVSDRYRDRAHLAIAALDRYRAQKASAASTKSAETEPQPIPARSATTPDNTVRAGATVIYRPPGERRAYPCRVERIEEGQAYLVPHLRAWTGWVSRENLSLAPLEEDPLGKGTIKACPALHVGSNTAGKLDASYAPSIAAQDNNPYSLQGGWGMADDEVEAVAAELAKAGGVSWHLGQERGPLKLVMDRYRDRARLAIATLERARAAKQDTSPGQSEVVQPESSAKANLEPVSRDVISAGSLVLYRPPGDKRTYPCRVEKVDGDRAYLVPEIPTCTGWVDLKSLSFPAIQ
jgi:hypothetical protein